MTEEITILIHTRVIVIFADSTSSESKLQGCASFTLKACSSVKVPFLLSSGEDSQVSLFDEIWKANVEYWREKVRVLRFLCSL
jgi:hypothetical protein